VVDLGGQAFSDNSFCFSDKHQNHKKIRIVIL
jgi:hypothetical protein